MHWLRYSCRLNCKGFERKRFFPDRGSLFAVTEYDMGYPERGLNPTPPAKKSELLLIPFA